MELRERDFRIFREVERWRFCLGRHIEFLAGFSSARTCDRRLRMLVDEGYLTRHRILYGVPNVYMLTRKSKTLIYANKRAEKIRLDQIMHDVTVLDVAICFIKALGLDSADIKTEKQLHQEGGFGTRTHHPDFVFVKNDKTYCVEVELSLKSKANVAGFILSIILLFLRLYVNLLIFLFVNLGEILLAINSRVNETQADTFAFEVGYGRELISGLYLLQKTTMHTKMSLAEQLKSSHPHTAHRIAHLERLENEYIDE